MAPHAAQELCREHAVEHEEQLVALVALFVFLLALGAYSPGEVLTLTIVMVALFVLWLGHAIFVSRRAQKRDPRAIAARERRGF